MLPRKRTNDVFRERLIFCYGDLHIYVSSREIYKVYFQREIFLTQADMSRRGENP